MRSLAEVKAIFKPYIKVKDNSKKAHALLSASGSERWLGCPGSARLCADLPATDNEWSIAGTHTHTLLQFILENNYHEELLSHPGSKAFKEHIGFTPAQLSSAKMAVKYVWAEYDRMKKETGHSPTLHIEKKLELEGVGFGTADIIIYQPFGVLHVMDFKNGRSPVECEENTQGLYYALAAADLHGWDFREVWITIIQPNAAHRQGPIRTWKTTPERLERAGYVFRAAAKATQKKNAPLVMNAKWCWFCPARPTCPEHMKGKQVSIMNRFDRDV
jgi:hypothetical protein